jgi:hypothetical protein
VVTGACLVVGDVVVLLVQDVHFQGCRCVLRFREAKANACLRADDSDACGRRSPLEASFMCPLLNPHRLISVRHLSLLGHLVPAVDPASRVLSLHHRRVWWWRS